MESWDLVIGNCSLSNMAVSIAQGWQKVKAQVRPCRWSSQKSNPPMTAAASREPKPT
jgi:hypothetical protein